MMGRLLGAALFALATGSSQAQLYLPSSFQARTIHNPEGADIFVRWGGSGPEVVLITADPAKPDEATREFFTATYAQPGGMRAGFAQFAAFAQDAQDIKVFEQTKLTMPVLAVGGEKSFGALQAVIMRHVATNVHYESTRPYKRVVLPSASVPSLQRSPPDAWG